MGREPELAGGPEENKQQGPSGDVVRGDMRSEGRNRTDLTAGFEEEGPGGTASGDL